MTGWSGAAAALGLLFSMAAAAEPATDARPDTVLLVADEWCPYNCAADRQPPGIAIELAERAFRSRGYAVQYRVVDWNEALERVRRGEADAAIGALYSEAPDLLFPALPFAYTEICLFTASGSTWEYRGVESLATLRIGAVAGYSYGSNLDRLIRDPDNAGRVILFDGSEPIRHLLMALTRGLVDVIVNDRTIVGYYTGTLDTDQRTRVAGCQPSTPVYFAFSPARPSRSQRLMSILDEAISEALQDGSMQALMERYGTRSE